MELTREKIERMEAGRESSPTRTSISESADRARKHYEELSGAACSYSSLIPQAIDAWERENTRPTTTVVYKDGSYKSVSANSAWEYENDSGWLVSILHEPHKGTLPDDVGCILLVEDLRVMLERIFLMPVSESDAQLVLNRINEILAEKKED